MSNETRRHRRRPSPAGNHDAPDATREDIAALIERFNFPLERGAVADWPGFARALARETRRYRLPMPFWLARFAGYAEPPVPLRVVTGGASEREKATAHGRLLRITHEAKEGGGIIITGTNNLIGKWKAHLDAQATKSATSPPPESGPPSTAKST